MSAGLLQSCHAQRQLTTSLLNTAIIDNFLILFGYRGMVARADDPPSQGNTFAPCYRVSLPCHVGFQFHVAEREEEKGKKEEPRVSFM